MLWSRWRASDCQKSFPTCVAFSREAFVEGLKLGMLECRSQVAEHHQGLDLSLDEGESEEEPFDEVATSDALSGVVLASVLEAASNELVSSITVKSITSKPLAVSKVASSHPTTIAEPSTVADSKEVGN